MNSVALLHVLVVPEHDNAIVTIVVVAGAGACVTVTEISGERREKDGSEWRVASSGEEHLYISFPAYCSIGLLNMTVPLRPSQWW